MLLVSADLDEIMSLSDRILVISEGRIVADVLAEGADERELGFLMTGGDHATMKADLQQTRHEAKSNDS